MVFEESSLLKRIKWISLYRVIIAFVSLLLIIFWKAKTDVIEQSNIFYKILALIFFVSIIYSIFIKRGKKLYVIAILQIIIDIIIVSLIVVYTGGIDSPFIFFYAFVIMEGGRLFGKNGAHIVMLSAIIFTGIVFLAQYNRFFQFNAILTQKTFYDKNDFFYTFSIFSLSFLILGLLVGYLFQETSKIYKEMAEQEARFYDLESLKTAIVNSLNSGLAVFTKDNLLTFMNEQAKQIAKMVDDINSEEAIKKLFEEEIKKVNNEQITWRSEKEIFNNKNENIWLGYSILPLYDHNRIQIGSLLNFQDITSIKKMEEQLRISDKFAFWGKLSAVIAHEIRNPLASLRGSVEYLSETVMLDEDNKKVFNILIREIERLNKIINDFLYYTRISEPEKTNIYVKNLIDEIWFELTFSDKKRSNFIYKFQGDNELVLLGDPNQIRQAFMNLILNAIEAMELKNNLNGSIIVTCEKNGKEVVITFEDEGGGIPENIINKVFDPFFSTKEKGTGIGLSIVYKIVQEHGGSIKVRNTDKGTQFILRFIQ